MSLNLAIMASGNGSNAQAMFEAVERGALDAAIRLVLCNRPGAGVLAKAQAHGVPTLVLDHTTFASREAFDGAAMEAIAHAGADTVALAGYMRLLTPDFLAAFPNRVVNIHPALLPAFKGLHGAADAHAWGVKVSGCTVHFVSPEMDCGPIIIQACVPVLQQDSPGDLQGRIHALEHRIYPQALQWLAQGRLAVQGRTVLLTPGPAGEQPPCPASGQAGFIWPPLETGF